MVSRLRSLVRRVTPPTTRALARRVAVEVLDRLTASAELASESLRPALPASAPASQTSAQPTSRIEVRPARPPTPPVAPAPPLRAQDLGWALARHVSAAFDTQLAALSARAFSPKAHKAGTHAEHKPERVRRMRVASRRLRSVIQLFGPWLPKKERKQLEADLKSITAALGPLRDLDVVVSQFRDGTKGDPLRRAAAEQISARLAQRHEAVRRRAAKSLRQVDRAHLQGALRDAKRLIIERLTECEDIRPALEGLLDDVAADAFAKTPIPTTLDDLEAVHEVRILAKRLRYAHGWVSPVMQHGPGPGRILKRAQRAVGDSRDLDLLLERLRHHEAGLRNEGQHVLGDAVAQWRESAEQRRTTIDTKILPALADLSLRTVIRLSHDGIGR